MQLYVNSVLEITLPNWKPLAFVSRVTVFLANSHKCHQHDCRFAWHPRHLRVFLVLHLNNFCVFYFSLNWLCLCVPVSLRSEVRKCLPAIKCPIAMLERVLNLAWRTGKWDCKYRDAPPSFKYVVWGHFGFAVKRGWKTCASNVLHVSPYQMKTLPTLLHICATITQQNHRLKAG